MSCSSRQQQQQQQPVVPAFYQSSTHHVAHTYARMLAGTYSIRYARPRGLLVASCPCQGGTGRSTAMPAAVSCPLRGWWMMCLASTSQ